MARIVDFSQSRAERLYRKGALYEERGHLEEALGLYSEVVQLNPFHADAHLNLAFGCLRLEQYGDAIRHASIALALKPSARAYYILGKVHLAQHDSAAALEAFRACLALDAEYADARYRLALAYYLQGEYEVAITEFHRAAQRVPDWDTFFFLGESYRLTARPADAERAFRKALAVAGNREQTEAAQVQLDAALRLAEFPDGFSFAMKERLYCEAGVVYLGTTRDDGVHIPPYLIHHFTYADVACTLRRFRRLQQARGWGWDCVRPADESSIPLAMALARLLDACAPDGERVLLALAIGNDHSHFQKATAAQNSFCLLSCWGEAWYADFTGVVSALPGSIPWQRSGEPPEAGAQEILEALTALPAEPNLTAQVDYYHRHARLRWQP